MKQIQLFIFAFCLLLITSCSKQVYTADIDTSYYRINYKNDTDTKLDKLIEPYKKQLDSQMNEVIASNPSEMKKSRPNSVLGNWFADALLESANELYSGNIDIAFQNHGGLRVPSLRKGDITVGNIYELMPFDNKLVLMTLDGKTTKMLLDRIAEKGGWPISHTLSFTIDNDKATKIKIKGEDFDESKSYTVVLPDYIANGGDNCFFLADGQREDNDLMIRDIIIDHLKNKPQEEKEIKADPNPRISTYKM